MKNKASLHNKIYRKLHWFLFYVLRPGDWLRNLYPAYCHGKKYAKAHGKRIDEAVNGQDYHSDVYLTQIPNEGAGIGHQVSNHNSGYHLASICNANFVYAKFSDSKWDEFLGFGNGTISVDELKKQGYKMKRMPYFTDGEEYGMLKNIVDSYNGKKVILITELDQFYKNQYEIMPYLKSKFENSPERKNDRLVYKADETNIAIHIRRGDIVSGQTSGKETLTKRWLDFTYYENVLEYIVKNIKPEKKMHIYIFSQDEEDYSSLEKYGEITKCIDMSAMDSFLHMVRADILVTSKSSFSYKPALLSDGIRICPPGFWHGYPDDEKWIVMDK